MEQNITVVKFGSELVASPEGVDVDKVNGYARGLVETYGADGLVVVTSGAVRAGEAKIIRWGEDPSDYQLETRAQLGGTTLMHTWETAFEQMNVKAGSLLVTHNEIDDAKEGPVLVKSMNLALGRGVVSIVNENDALSDAELMKLACGGENDGLAAHIACAIGANTLKLFTKKGGIVDDQNRLVEQVDQSNYAKVKAMVVERMRSKPTDKLSRGGITSKLDAAWRAARVGIRAEIAATEPSMKGERVTRVVW